MSAGEESLASDAAPASFLKPPFDRLPLGFSRPPFLPSANRPLVDGAPILLHHHHIPADVIAPVAWLAQLAQQSVLVQWLWLLRRSWLVLTLLLKLRLADPGCWLACLPSFPRSPYRICGSRCSGSVHSLYLPGEVSLRTGRPVSVIIQNQPMTFFLTSGCSGCRLNFGIILSIKCSLHI